MSSPDDPNGSWGQSLAAALAAGFIYRPYRMGLVPFLSLHEHQRVIAYARFVERVQTVPGVIVEVGVGRGDSLLAMAAHEAILRPHDIGPRVFGFDTGEGFPHISARDDGPDPSVDRVPGGFGISGMLEHLRGAIEFFEDQKDISRRMIELIIGDACETIPEFVARYDGAGQEQSSLAIKLLHVDCDLYEPTLAALEHLGPLLVPGAIVVLDEWNWGRDQYPGETRAVREYFAGNLPEIRQDHWRQPGGWFRVTTKLASRMRGR